MSYGPLKRTIEMSCRQLSPNISKVSPQGYCSEVSLGFFERQYSKASIRMDCGSWEGTITVKDDDLTIV